MQRKQDVLEEIKEISEIHDLSVHELRVKEPEQLQKHAPKQSARLTKRKAGKNNVIRSKKLDSDIRGRDANFDYDASQELALYNNPLGSMKDFKPLYPEQYYDPDLNPDGRPEQFRSTSTNDTVLTRPFVNKFDFMNYEVSILGN